MKIVLINHTFQKERFYKRWKMLAQKHPDLDVTLLAPDNWTWGAGKTLTFGEIEKKQGVEIDEGNFHIRLIDIQKHGNFGWTSKLMPEVLCQIQPDIIYYIGLHTQEVIQQLISIRNRKLPKAKLMVFSMRGEYHAIRVRKGKCDPVRWLARRFVYFYTKWKVSRLNKNADAIFCHYPDGRDEFIREGYKGPIYMQTQVGVDMDYFHYDEAARAKIREKYQIGDAYLFGSASRFHPSKGLFDVIAALPQEGNWKFLMMGSGLPAENEAIEKAIAERGLQDKIILTGFIDLEDMAEHWNALDCAVHVPRTTEMWEETFSLALVQAMVTGLPVIGSSSGSVPYQIGPDGIVLEEGNIKKLHDQFVYMLEHPEEGKRIGEKMFQRASKCFSITHLNDCFYDTIVDVYNGVHDDKKADMAAYLVD